MTAATGTILDRILETKRQEVAALKASASFADRKARAEEAEPTRGFARAIRPSPPAPLPALRERGEDQSGSPSPTAKREDRERGPGGEGRIALIAEVKKASPSKGVLRADFDPVAIARAYHDGGATCLSVLTDETYFQGHLGYLQQIRDAVPLPLLRKDFIIDPAQVYEARAAGADAILLIVAAVPSPARLAELRHVAETLGMDALVEVHDRRELDIAVESGAKLIGVNNRDLKTFAVRLETTIELLPHFPPNTIAVAESGIFTHEDVERLHNAGAHAVLVGESLMRADDIAAATRKLLTPLSHREAGRSGEHLGGPSVGVRA